MVDSGVGAYERQNPAVAMLGSGEFAIVWEDVSSANINLLLQRFDSLGVRLGAILDMGSSNRADIHPHVSVVAGNKIFVAWNQKNTLNNTHRVNYKYFNFNTPESSNSVSISSSNEAHPIIVERDNGGAAILYEQGSVGSQRIVARNISSVGAISAIYDVLAARNLLSWSAAGSSTGQVMLTWQENGGSLSDIFARRFAKGPGDTEFSEIFQVNAYSLNQQQRPVLVQAASGKSVLIWDGEGNDESAGVFGKGLSESEAPLLTN